MKKIAILFLLIIVAAAGAIYFLRLRQSQKSEKAQEVPVTVKQQHFFIPEVDPGGDIYQIEFLIPDGLKVEYIQSIKAINLYEAFGNGSNLERSRVLLTYFDASRFLTLSTVTIYQVDDVLVGQKGYVGRRYDIEKKSGTADFKNQPSWRNQRHIATDFREREGHTRYYSIAASPNLDQDIYQSILDSVFIR